MELLDGLDLEQLVTRYGPLPPARAVFLLRQIAESLGDAHDHGFVHRDVKPANIFVSRLGRRSDYVKVLDFGLVKQLDERRRGRGARLGRQRGQRHARVHGARNGDGRARRRARRRLRARLRRVLHGDRRAGVRRTHPDSAGRGPRQRAAATSVRTLRHAAPAALERAIMRCLEKDPERRYQDAGDLSRDLEGSVAPVPWTDDLAAAWWRSRPAACVRSAKRRRVTNITRGMEHSCSSDAVEMATAAVILPTDPTPVEGELAKCRRFSATPSDTTSLHRARNHPYNGTAL